MRLETAEKLAHIAQTTLFTATALATMAGIILPLHAGLSPMWFAFLCVGGFLTGLCAAASVSILVNDKVSLWLYGIEQNSNDIQVIDLDLNNQE